MRKRLKTIDWEVDLKEMSEIGEWKYYSVYQRTCSTKKGIEEGKKRSAI